MPAAARLVALCAGVAGLAVAAALLPVRSLAGLGPATGVLLGAALLIALVPRTPISVACGALFGPALGPLCALLAAIVAAVATFAAGRLLGRPFFAGRVARLDTWIGSGGALAVATVRAVPLAPFGMMGYLFGASSVRPAAYLAGTLLAATPSAISYAILGAVVTRPGEFHPLALVPLGAGLLLAVLLFRRGRR